MFRSDAVPLHRTPLALLSPNSHIARERLALAPARLIRHSLVTLRTLSHVFMHHITSCSSPSSNAFTEKNSTRSERTALLPPWLQYLCRYACVCSSEQLERTLCVRRLGRNGGQKVRGAVRLTRRTVDQRAAVLFLVSSTLKKHICSAFSSCHGAIPAFSRDKACIGTDFARREDPLIVVFGSLGVPACLLMKGSALRITCRGTHRMRGSTRFRHALVTRLTHFSMRNATLFHAILYHQVRGAPLIYGNCRRLLCSCSRSVASCGLSRRLTLIAPLAQSALLASTSAWKVRLTGQYILCFPIG